MENFNIPIVDFPPIPTTFSDDIEDVPNPFVGVGWRFIDSGSGKPIADATLILNFK
jgi:hypothetical protein